MLSTLETLDAITLDTWNHTDTTGRINSFLANRALALVELEDFSGDESFSEA